MIGLRSIYGISWKHFQTLFSDEIQSYFLENIQAYLDQNIIILQDEMYKLQPQHYFKADGIASDLFWV